MLPSPCAASWALKAITSGVLSSTSPVPSMDMIRFKTCSSIEPRICFEASNAQTLTGRLGLSRYLFSTKDSSASIPRPPCTKSAKGPSRRHSPTSAPGLDPSVGIAVGGEVDEVVLEAGVLLEAAVVVEVVRVVELAKVVLWMEDVAVDGAAVRDGVGGGRSGSWSFGTPSMLTSLVPKTTIISLLRSITGPSTYREQS